MEKRKFQRVRFTARCALTHNGITYHGQTENISLSGALISFNDGIIVPKDDECVVLVFLDEEGAPLRMVAEVVYSFFTMLGTKFVKVDPESQARLYSLVERTCAEPARLKEELENIQNALSECPGPQQ